MRDLPAGALHFLAVCLVVGRKRDNLLGHAMGVSNLTDSSGSGGIAAVGTAAGGGIGQIVQSAAPFSGAANYLFRWGRVAR